ncbi:MAG: winged helix-turn-helix transcriptional regulator, partial [Alphaproteobacteria bacterium]
MQKLNTDPLDLSILRHLRNNALLTNVELSALVNL